MPGPFTLQQIAQRLGGRAVGESGILIRQVGSLERATREQITFLSNSKLKAKLAETRAGAVILAPENESLTGLPRILADMAAPVAMPADPPTMALAPRLPLSGSAMCMEPPLPRQ